ncbi:hypothetical protein [Streptomyces sp. NPDC015350]|uniref:hypothetical protein n=1 Tax=Streptomyces sp. NPDC015350 TaxID=3364955 RepID=UPI003703355D
MNIQPLLDALGIQENAARALADGLREQTAELQGRLRKAEAHLEHLAITRKTVTALAHRLPARPPRPTCPSTPTTPYPRRSQPGHRPAAGPRRLRSP